MFLDYVKGDARKPVKKPEHTNTRSKQCNRADICLKEIL